MKTILISVFAVLCLSAGAQIKKATLQASGLTCSMCSNAINKSLKSLDFVEKVEANIKNSSFDVTFKPGTAIDFDKMKAKVEDAGFFVAQFTAFINFNNTAVENDSHVAAENMTFHFLNVNKQVLTGEKKIRLLDKGFLPAKDYKKNNAFTKMPCYKTGEENGKRIFHVTI